ncbi:MAG: hypothetical protein HKM89_04210 [Gemmatimonadales bacterium]|nr:hypothetical protein [Gemmatimonadales bacterium]
MHPSVPQPTRRVHHTALFALLLVVLSCGPGPLDPRVTGGQLLPGTEGVEYFGGRPFSISPDGRWLLFAKALADEAADAPDDLESLMLRQLQAFVLYDLDELEGTPVALSAGTRELVASGSAFLPDGGCWIPDDGETRGGQRGRVVITDEFGRYVGVDPDAAQPAWEVIESEPFAYGEYCPREDNARSEPETVGPFQIAHAGGRLVIIVDARDPHKVFAMHRAPKFPGMRLMLGDVQLTEDGWRLAYTVTPNFGSFVGNARGFVVSYGAPPERPTVLAAPIHALRWAPDGSTVYADVEHEGQTAIYRWRLPRHGNEKTFPIATR